MSRGNDKENTKIYRQQELPHIDPVVQLYDLYSEFHTMSQASPEADPAHGTWF